MVMGILEEREKRWLFFFSCEYGYISFSLTAEERINTDEPYLVCVCVFAGEGLDLEL